MRAPTTVRAAEEFGRVRLSHSFFMRDFLHSEITSLNGMANLPNDPYLVSISVHSITKFRTPSWRFHLIPPTKLSTIERAW